MMQRGAEAAADSIAAATTSCPSVARMSAGDLREVVTYLPGRRVEGVRMTDDGVEVHVVVRWDVSLPAAADEIREALTPVVGDLPVSVFIDDVETPDERPGSS
jgi:uncharacterized alkaline shock family protein YloU